jgi:hypothetical protein
VSTPPTLPSEEIANVLVLAAAVQTPHEVMLQGQLLDRLNALAKVEAVAVNLPRAEAMLAPRLIGLWTHMLFVGTGHSPELPHDEAVLEREREFLVSMPPVVVLGRAAELWARWQPFHAALAQSDPDGVSVDPHEPDVVDRVLIAMRLQHRQPAKPHVRGESEGFRSPS